MFFFDILHIVHTYQIFFLNIRIASRSSVPGRHPSQAGIQSLVNMILGIHTSHMNVTYVYCIYLIYIYTYYIYIFPFEFPLHFEGAWVPYKAEKTSFFIPENGVGSLALVDKAVVRIIMLNA